MIVIYSRRMFVADHYLKYLARRDRGNPRLYHSARKVTGLSGKHGTARVINHGDQLKGISRDNRNEFHLVDPTGSDAENRMCELAYHCGFEIKRIPPSSW